MILLYNIKVLKEYNLFADYTIEIIKFYCCPAKKKVDETYQPRKIMLSRWDAVHYP